MSGAPAVPRLGPDAAIPIIDWATLALRAGRDAPILPHMAWCLRFPDALTREEIETEARRLASTPYGFGRRVAPARLPGGRPRWVPAPDPPPVDYSSEPVSARDGLAIWLNRQLGRPLDPEHDGGWILAATRLDDGGTAVLVICHHLFGTGGGIIRALYGSDEDPTYGTTETPFTDETRFTVWDELRGILERVTLGLRALAQIPRQLVAMLRSRRRRPDAAASGPAPLDPPRGRDRTRRPPTYLRTGAVGTMEAELWDGAAAQRGGTGNTLLAAVAANLLRRARMARGGDVDRPLRLLCPMDLRGREAAEVEKMTSGPAPQMTTAAVLLPGGPPQYGDLRDMRERMKAAFIADSTSAPMVRGAGDVMRLLPERVTIRFAARAAEQFDGVASNIGPVPERMLSIGEHRASDMAMIGFPIGNEALFAICRFDGHLGVSAVTDPARLGPAADFREWLADELEGWGLPRDAVW